MMCGLARRWRQREVAERHCSTGETDPGRRAIRAGSFNQRRIRSKKDDHTTIRRKKSDSFLILRLLRAVAEFDRHGDAGADRILADLSDPDCQLTSWLSDHVRDDVIARGHSTVEAKCAWGTLPVVSRRRDVPDGRCRFGGIDWWRWGGSSYGKALKNGVDPRRLAL